MSCNTSRVLPLVVFVEVEQDSNCVMKRVAGTGDGQVCPISASSFSKQSRTANKGRSKYWDRAS